MSVKSVLLISLFPSCLFAQTMNLNVKAPSVTVKADSAFVSMKIDANLQNFSSKQQITLTPILTSDKEQVELPQVIMNGKLMSKIYKRRQKLLDRMSTPSSTSVDNKPYSVMDVKDGDVSVDYTGATVAKAWIYQANLYIRKDVFDTKGRKIQSEKFSVINNNEPSTTAHDRSETVSASVPVINSVTADGGNNKSENVLSENHYKGSFVAPVSDATDENNKKRLDFSLEEARVIANVNPQMLSLRELYTVALSYKNNPSQFYHVLYVSVKVYPSDPTANLNAASAALEQGNVNAAGRYLQIATHGTTAYKNCRGAYELLCNNTYEGISLLKAAKSEGSEEAAQNLKIFFDRNKQPQQ